MNARRDTCDRGLSHPVKGTGAVENGLTYKKCVGKASVHFKLGRIHWGF